MSRPVRSGFQHHGPSTPARRRPLSGRVTTGHKKSVVKGPPGWTCRSCGAHNTSSALQCHACDGHLPSITLFKAHTIIEGRYRFTRISWETQGADSVRITPGRGDLPASGVIELDVEPDTVFTLVAGNQIGTRKITTGISIAPPRITRFEAADTEIQIGYPVILSWEVENAEKVELNQGIGDVTGRTFLEVSLEKPEPLILTVSNEQGKDTRQVEFTLPLPE
ncbi:MAG: hypothetical protein AAFV07_02540, partial [Bacteroidota bacterium]